MAASGRNHQFGGRSCAEAPRDRCHHSTSRHQSRPPNTVRAGRATRGIIEPMPAPPSEIVSFFLYGIEALPVAVEVRPIGTGELPREDAQRRSGRLPARAQMQPPSSARHLPPAGGGPPSPRQIWPGRCTNERRVLRPSVLGLDRRSMFQAPRTYGVAGECGGTAHGPLRTSTSGRRISSLVDSPRRRRSPACASTGEFAARAIGQG